MIRFLSALLVASSLLASATAFGREEPRPTAEEVAAASRSKQKIIDDAAIVFGVAALATIIGTAVITATVAMDYGRGELDGRGPDGDLSVPYAVGGVFAGVGHVMAVPTVAIIFGLRYERSTAAIDAPGGAMGFAARF